MKVLVAYASKHDATAEIAEAIGRGLSDRGLGTTVSSVADVSGLEGFDAVVLGSAVYAGRWLEAARHFVDEHAAELAKRPTWLFSSGPIGDPPRPSGDDAVRITEIAQKTGASEHRLFSGRLDKSALGLGERAVVTAFRSPEGDFRDWPEIDSWAETIAGMLERPTDTARGGAVPAAG